MWGVGPERAQVVLRRAGIIPTLDATRTNLADYDGKE